MVDWLLWLALTQVVVLFNLVVWAVVDRSLTFLTHVVDASRLRVPPEA